MSPPQVPLTKEERREKREERRNLQRRNNLLRAGKMHGARLEWKKKSPGDKSPTVSVPKKVSLHIGCSGWFYWHWRGAFYPDNLPTSEWFDHYVSKFDTVELNAPFYSWPTLNTVRSWIRQAGDRKIVYTVKVCELITHVKRFVGTKTLVRDFSHIADLLGDYMGCFLFQLPPSYHYTPGRLKSIVSQLDHSRRNVVEFRHKSWWNEKVYSTFRKNRTIFCSCSGPRLPRDLIRTADDIYVRFHGTSQWYRHDYGREELKVWADKIRRCEARGVYAYFNNDREAHAIKNAKALLKMLQR